MACHSRGGDYGSAAPSEGPQSTKLHSSSDSVAEWRSREQLEPSPPSTSPAYWDSDDEDDSNSSSIVGPKPSELYGKFTWKIENFSEISKRELRSNIFEVGGYKWYILVYPQGCDVCNHLSLFLCVADYDKLLPGWSHFAQFTIAVVNKDPKKSKYSDTLHRFCKKEHDWGWKKFMELSKVLDGFTVADTLVIKAQVQVIRENPHRPFRCLDCQYRRELVRVYLTNVEGICRRFVEEKREKLGKLMEDAPRWASFRTFWSAVEEGARYRLAREKTDVILKAVVKRFFNEKEVTSTLVMDALYSGCKALDYRTRNKKGKINGVDMEEAVSPVVWVEKDAFVLAGDVLVLLERAVAESLPPYKDDKGPQNRTKDIGSGDEFGKDSVERDERRLTELGRRTVEMFVLAHLYTNRVEVAYREAVALKRQEELIREEEAAGQAETELRIKREAAEKEKRSKKKQAKQRRKDRKEKDKEAEEKKVRVEQEQRQRQDHPTTRESKDNSHKERELSPLVSTEAGEDEDELSGLDPIDDVVGTLGPAIEDGDTDHVSWEREASHGQNGMEAGFSGALLKDTTRSRRSSRKQQATGDDSSSTCSSDSLPSVRTAMNESFVARPILPEQSHINSSRDRNGGESEIYDPDGQYIDADGMLRATGSDANGTGEPSSSTSSVGVDSETVILSLKDRVRWLEQRLLEKEEEVVILQQQLSLHQMDLDRPGRRLGDEATDISRGVHSRDVVSVEEGRGETSTSVQSDLGSASELDKAHSNAVSMHGPVHMNGHIGLSNGNVAPTRSTHSGGPAVNENRNSSHVQGGPSKLDPVRNAPAPSRSKSVDSSRPPRVLTPPITGFSTAVTGSVAVPEEPNMLHPPPSTSAGPGLPVSRPSSAPGLVAGGRPNIPVASSAMHASQPLTRSISVGGRPAVGMEAAATAHANGMPLQSPPVTPSYKNATIGKTRSFSGTGLATYSMNSHPSISGPIQSGMSSSSASSYMSSSSLQPPASQAIAPPTSSVPTSSPPLTPSPKVRSVPGPAASLVANGTKGEAAAFGTPVVSSAPLSSPSGTETVAASHIMRENSGGGGSSSGHPSVGFTFGTVTPELLQDDQLELPPPLEQPPHDDRDLSQQSKEPQLQQGSHQNIMRQTTGQQMLQQQQRTPGTSPEMNGGPGIFRSRQATSGVTLLESLHNGAVMSEEFPHLDIINDLLDEDQNLGMALKMLQNTDSPGHSPLKQFYGQTAADRGNGLAGDGGDRSRVAENEEERPNSNGLRMNVPIQHPSLGRQYSLHGQYWQLGSTGMPSGHSNGSGRNGLVDSHLAYSLVQGHRLSVPDCSGFSLGHNGYTVYPPAHQP
ncbi:unnamed protein product [Calypogeia fissa]